MKQAPLYSEWCSLSYLSRNAIWAYRYFRLRGGADSPIFRLEFYRDSFVVKFLWMRVRTVHFSDIQYVEFWETIYGPRIRVFVRDSDRTIVLSVKDPRRMQEMFKELGIHWSLSEEDLDSGPGARSG